MTKNVLFIELCNEFEKIDKTTKRLEIQAILSDFLKNVIENDPRSLSAVLFLCNASIYPEYYNKELGIGDFIIQTTVSEATGLSIKALKKKYIESGDLSIIAMDNRVNTLFIPKNRLTVIDVLDKLRDIASKTGKSSVNDKKNIMKSSISICSPLETKYMIRLFECKLRIGLALKTILIALSIAFGEEVPQIVKDAYDKQSDFEYLSKNLLEYGTKRLPYVCTIVPGIPLKPMLAQPSKNLIKAFSKFENETFLSEFKYDGKRVQIHYFDCQTRIFSRNCEDFTIKYPDISDLKISDKSFILDGEAVAYKNGEILPFQILSTGKRKNVLFETETTSNLIDFQIFRNKKSWPDLTEPENTECSDSKGDDTELIYKNIKDKNKDTFENSNVSVCVFCFDILYFDNKELLNLTLEERREILRNNFDEIKNKFYFANSLKINNIEDIDDHFKKSLQENCEGIMLKSLKSTYKPSHRTNSWVKIKSDYLDSVGDSLDLVVIGAFYGKGKRTGSFGGFLLAAYNDETDMYEACCKIGTGFTDENLKNFYNILGPLITTNTSQIRHNDKNVKPDVWVKPHYVWEVKAASLSLSPVYSTGSLEKGISLRFPRFIKERPDRKPKDSTTSNQLMRMYSENKNQASDEEDEFN